MSTPVPPSNLHLHDLHPEPLRLRDAVLTGLSGETKNLPPKFFYDERGSMLFESICEQPEYYIPTVETGLLKTIGPELTELIGEGRLIFEPGAGSGAKIRLLLDALRPDGFVPMDISRDFLFASARKLATERPTMRVDAVCVDFTQAVPVPEPAGNAPRLAFFPGSSLGNFAPSEAEVFLRMIRASLGADGVLLIGVDTQKPKPILDAAYNDAAGVTAQFNLNVLNRIRRELDTDCDPERFEHRAFYNESEGRIEMHLISREAHSMRVEDTHFSFAKGEGICTEYSYKYSPEQFIELAGRAGFTLIRLWQDPDALFAIYLLRPNNN